MLRELSTAHAPMAHPARPALAASSTVTPAVVHGSSGVAAPDLATVVPPVERALQAAASALFRDRPVEVQGFRDEASGRFVYRIADRQSGEVLMQSPPEALLRFFASAREALGPLVEIEA